MVTWPEERRVASEVLIFPNVVALGDKLGKLKDEGDGSDEAGDVTQCLCAGCNFASPPFNFGVIPLVLCLLSCSLSSGELYCRGVCSCKSV